MEESDQPLHELLANGIFAVVGHCGRPSSTGKCAIYVPFGIFKEWLTGDSPEPQSDCRTDWLKTKALGFRVPVEITPGQHGIPLQCLEEAAYQAKCPEAFPSDAQLAQLALEIRQSDDQLKAAADHAACCRGGCAKQVAEAVWQSRR